jgi:hypothetical protein
MTPVVQLYWIRVALGIIAGAVSAAIAALFGNINDSTWLVNSITMALIIYFITYYALKAVYNGKIEKVSKILSTGIGMYFFTWITFFVLFYTIILVIMG